MAAEKYPTDNEGMPRPIITPNHCKLLHPAGSWNRHHAWYFSRRFLSGGPAARASRYAWRQLVPEDDHNVIHDEFQEGVSLPTSYDHETWCVLAGLTGYIANEGLLVRGKGVTQVPVNNHYRRILRHPRTITTEKDPDKLHELADFIFGRIVKDGLAVSAEKHHRIVEHFLDRPHRVELASEIMFTAASITLAPHFGLYQEVRNRKMLRIDAPNDPATAFMQQMKRGSFDMSGRLYEVLAEQSVIPSEAPLLVAG